MIYFSVLLALLTVALVSERVLHGRTRRAVQHRIHVNGIRGKSSVTRLITAGLQGGGIRAWGKVTGTRPIIIDGDGAEIEIHRVNSSNLSEQRTVFALAARSNAEALVIECMAIRPEFQRIAEEGFVQATIAVITNVRPDHLEAYGDRFASVAHALAKTVPYRGTLFTTPGPAVPMFAHVARQRGSSVIVAEASEVDEAVLQRFSYFEHRENVALALRVCDHLGVSRERALSAMTRALPDPGVLRVFQARKDGRIIHVINALAANDPESTLHLYQRLVDGRRDCPLFLFVNCRRDRPLRSIQLGRLLPVIPADRYFIAGDDVRSVIASASEAGLPTSKASDCGGLRPSALVTRVFDEVATEAVLFAIGNTGAGGLQTIDELQTYEWQAPA